MLGKNHPEEADGERVCSNQKLLWAPEALITSLSEEKKRIFNLSDSFFFWALKNEIMETLK